MIEIFVKMDPRTGEIQFGATEGVNQVMLIGLLETAKAMMIDATLRPKPASGLVTPAKPSLVL